MNKSILRWKRSIVVATLALAMLFVFATNTIFVSAAENTTTVQVTGEYGQTEARTMLDMVNDFRTGRYIDGNQTQVWALDKNEKIDTSTYENLGELKYDYELEKVAMQRAMETALSFAHQRPNGKSCDSLFPDGYTATGENIATGYGEGSNQTAWDSFDSWCETSDSYDGQGHRRNMLYRGFNRIGVGHVAIKWSGRLTEGDRPYNYSTTIHFWVQEFGFRTDSFGLTQTSASDVSETREIEILPSKVTKAGITKSKDNLTITYGDSYEFNDATSSIRYADTFPNMFNLTWSDGPTSKGTYMLPIEGAYSLSSNNQTVVSISGKTINTLNAGEATVTIEPEMAGAESEVVNVKVVPASLSNADIIISNPTYTGEALTPVPTVSVNGKTLIRNQDYEVSYSNNIKAGKNTATVTVRGKGNYKDYARKNFSIEAKSITSDMIDNIPSLTFTGAAKTPDVTVRNGSMTLVKNTDYTVVYSNNINAGTATATITGKGNYMGTVSKNFIINAKALADNMVTLDKTSVEYSGQNQKPTVTVKDGTKTLVENTDYTLVNAGGTNADTYNVSVTGKGNYSGAISKNFTITSKTITSDMIDSIPNHTYTGSAQTPNVTVRNGSVIAKKDTDYSVVYSNNTNAGTATATITGKGNYKGTVSKSFTISAKALTDAMVALNKTSFEYSGQNQKPAVTVKDGSKTLVEGTDYTLTNGGGTNAGSYNVSVTGKGNYSGSISKNFTITRKTITADMIVSIPNHTYTGNVQTPSVTVRFGSMALANGKDYTVTYSNNTNAGTARVAVEGIGNFDGKISTSFTINKKNLTDGDIAAEEIPAQVFDGNEVTPIPSIKYNDKRLTSNEFDLEYANNKAEGTGSVNVIGKGNFNGSRTLTFSIISKERAELRSLIQDLEKDLEGETDKEYVSAINEALEEARAADTANADSEYISSIINNVKAKKETAANALKEKKEAAAKATQKGADGTSLGKGASAVAAEAAITTSSSDEGPKGSRYAPLQLRSTKQANTSITLVWSGVSGARKYVVYGNACGKYNKMKKLTTITGKAFNAGKLANGKTLAKGTYHKFMVVALDANNNVVSTSKVIHVATKGNKKIGNPTKVTTKKVKALKKGKTFKLGAKQVGKKVKKHRGLAYETSNAKVATISSKGVIKAVGKGTCYVYAYAQNGAFKKVKVVVK